MRKGQAEQGGFQPLHVFLTVTRLVNSLDSTASAMLLQNLVFLRGHLPKGLMVLDRQGEYKVEVRPCPRCTVFHL